MKKVVIVSIVGIIIAVGAFFAGSASNHTVEVQTVTKNVTSSVDTCLAAWIKAFGTDEIQPECERLTPVQKDEVENIVAEMMATFFADIEVSVEDN